MPKLGELRYLRHRLYGRMLRPFAHRARARRMQEMSRRLCLESGDRVLDLGGWAAIWEYVDCPLSVTILNLPGKVVRWEASSVHSFEYIEGDACDVSTFEDASFDIAFSNSVIEHVGPEFQQRQLASQVRRLGRAYWVQTPCKWYPIEAHSGMPFWWFYPAPLRQLLLRGWRRKLPKWTVAIENTRVLTRRQLRELFPGCRVYLERSLGLPKSFSAYSTHRSRGETSAGDRTAAPARHHPAPRRRAHRS